MPAPVRWAGQVLSWVVILAAGAALAAGLLVPRLAGGTPYVVETGSMRPELPPGTLVVTRPVEPSTIGLGDVITYQLEPGEPTVVTHRVVATGIDATGEPRWRTQGDANDVPDESWVLPVQVQGKRWYAVPLLGQVTSFVSGQQRQVLTFLTAAGLLGYALRMFLASRRERRSTSPRPAAHAARRHADVGT